MAAHINTTKIITHGFETESGNRSAKDAVYLASAA
jgi:hypothetical protein